MPRDAASGHPAVEQHGVDLATLVNLWARNLKAQGFLDRATVTGEKTWATPQPGLHRAGPNDVVPR